MKGSLGGVLPVVQTPFDARGEIDWATLRRQVRWLLDLGVHGVCAAMVSEWLRLTCQERLRYMEQLVQAVEGRGTVVVSVGAESTYEALRYAQAAQRAGCDAIMAIPPTSQKIPEPELEQYFAALAEGVSLPLVVQDASSYVGSPLSVDLMVRLLERYGEEKIYFKPEAAPLGPNLSALQEATGGRARVFDGSGGIALVDTYRRGLVGTMPGADLAGPIVQLWNALGQGDQERIYRISLPLVALVALQMQAGLDGFLQIEKYLLVKQKVFDNTQCRGPIAWHLDEQTRQEVDRLFALLQQACAGQGSPGHTG